MFIPMWWRIECLLPHDLLLVYFNDGKESINTKQCYLFLQTGEYEQITNDLVYI